MNGFRVRPHQIVIALAALFALVTVGSGIAATLLQFHGDSPVSREVFANIPSAMKAAFYVVVPVALVLSGWLFAVRVRNWERGTPDRRTTDKKTVHRRLAALRSGLWMRTLMRDPAAGLMHSLIYFGFLVLFAVTTVLEIDHQLPDDLKFLHGDTYRAYVLIGDLAGVAFVAGILWAIGRRYIQRPYRIRIKTKPEDAVILGMFLVLGLSGFAAEAFRIALDGRPDFEQWSFIGYPLSGLVDGWSGLQGWHQSMWVVHVAAFVMFLVVLPITKLRHMITSPVNMYLGPRERPKGAMKPMPNLMETEMESFGAATIEEFTWKQLLDTDACTICGRCTSVCPANATGKPLDPREIVLKVGEVMAASAQGGPISPPVGVDRDIEVPVDQVFGRIDPEEIWSCVSCKACDEICPVDIEILDKILDMRRYLSLMESNFPTELGQAYRAMENQGNPWGMAQGERADWADGIPTEVPIVDGSSALDHEYLYWVGCAGSFDDKNKKVTQAVAQLLARAGIDFAILGPAENCTGDPARRSGNEYIFQMLAMQNVETLNGMGVKKIITQCPHCFNTLGNEYPQLGGTYEVIHHSQLLEQLIETGQLDMSGARLDERLVYHDSCYLGRHNDVYLSPRKVVGSIAGLQVVEAPRSGTRGMCCGAGGARMWMEEHVGTKINTERSAELIATGASRIATACPFCYVMIDDGAKEHGKDDDEVKVGDISLHLLDALKAGDAARAAGNGNGQAPAPEVEAPPATVSAGDEVADTGTEPTE